jgi:hypothetical protein
VSNINICNLMEMPEHAKALRVSISSRWSRRMSCRRRRRASDRIGIIALESTTPGSRWMATFLPVARRPG